MFLHLIFALTFAHRPACPTHVETHVQAPAHPVAGGHVSRHPLAPAHDRIPRP